VTRRIAAAFERARGATGLIPFLTVGYPSLEATLDCMARLERAGARAIEVGIPFSDPIADGPEIQRASEWALRRGVTASDALELVAEFRRAGGQTPVVVMTYANPVLCLGADRFAAAASDSGVDGVIVSDLPPDESPDVWRAFDSNGLDTVLLVAPTTSADRLPRILDRCRGFVYCLARTGVTGRAEGYAGSLSERIADLRRRTALPIAVGFGISSAADAGALAGLPDAIVVGAAFMRSIAEDPERGAPRRVERLARELQGALG
jgi:tryptophan synthase alpha chain